MVLVDEKFVPLLEFKVTVVWWLGASNLLSELERASGPTSATPFSGNFDLHPPPTLNTCTHLRHRQHHLQIQPASPHQSLHLADRFIPQKWHRLQPSPPATAQ